MVKVVKKKRSKEKQKGVRILIIFIVIIGILVIILIGGGQQANPEKFAPESNPNPPASAPCELREKGANLTRFNLSDPCFLSIEDFAEIVRQWVHDNATMDDVMLAIKLWQANRSGTPSR